MRFPRREPDARRRLDCVIRGVKVDGLLRQATVIELRLNRRQQPFDPRAAKRPEPTPAGEPRGDAGDQ